MNPNDPTFQSRREVEHILVILADAGYRLVPVLTRLVQKARTDDDALDIDELITVRRQIQKAHKLVGEMQR